MWTNLADTGTSRGSLRVAEALLSPLEVASWGPYQVGALAGSKAFPFALVWVTAAV